MTNTELKKKEVKKVIIKLAIGWIVLLLLIVLSVIFELYRFTKMEDCLRSVIMYACLGSFAYVSIVSFAISATKTYLIKKGDQIRMMLKLNNVIKQ